MRKRIMAFIMSAVVAVSPVMAVAEETELQGVMEDFTDESAVSPAENGQEQEPAVMPENQDIPGDAEIPAPAEEIPAEETVEPSNEDTEQVEDFIIMEEEMPVEESANASAFPDEGIIFEETMEASSDSENSGYEDNGMSGEIRMPLIFPTEDTIRKMQNPEFKPEAKSAKQKTFKVTENDTDSVKREKALQAMGDNEGETVTESIEDACLCAASYYNNYETAFEGVREDLYDLAVRTLKGMKKGEYSETFTKDHTFLCETHDIDELKDSYNTDDLEYAIYAYMCGNESLKYEFENTMLDAIILAGYDNPEYYWANNYTYYNSYNWKTDSGSNTVTVYVSKLTIIPTETFPGALNRQKKAINTLNGIYSNLCSTANSDINYDGNVSDYEYLLALHDYIRKNTYYDINGLNSCMANPNSNNPSMSVYTPDALFNKNTGGMVCTGYARAFKIFCDKRKIKCFIALSNTHAWNIVYFNGNWYTVDVTWDDTGYDYEYFLCGTDFARKYNKDHNITDIPVRNIKITVPNLSKTEYMEKESEHKLTILSSHSEKGSAKCLVKICAEYECETCGAITESQMEIVNEGTDEGYQHVYGPWKTTTKPTYTRAGMKWGFCKYCGCGRYASIPALDPCLKVSKPSNKKIDIKKGKTFQIKASSKTGITYSTTNKKVATVTANGKVKGVKKGTCKIKVKSGTKTITIKVTIK